MGRVARRQDFERVAGQLSRMMDQLTRWRFGDFCPIDSWTPQINAYRLARRLEICVDLAGVAREHIEVHVEPGRLILRGIRQSPEPRHPPGELMRILSMEIDHGQFCRTIALPDQVELQKVESEYVNGMLWIRLPLREQG